MSALRRPRAVAACAVIILAIAGTLAGCAFLASAPAIDTVGKADFDTKLPIPPLAPSTVASDGTRVFDLTAQKGRTQIVPGAATETAGYSQSYLGPTLRANVGENVRVQLHNELGEITTLHWHGMHLPAAIDGGPHQPVKPGADWDPQWTINQPAATLWYHPHPDGETEKQVGEGLAGLFILDDAASQALPLPKQYGVDDIPLIVQDVALDDDNQFTDRDGGYSGSLGDHILVNGAQTPHLDVSTDVVRLRLLNASPARVFNFTFSDDRQFDLIGTDGGLLTAPAPMTHVQLSPGERAEILVHVKASETVALRSEKPALGDTSAWNGGNGGSDRFDVLQLRGADTLAHAGEVPDALVPMTRLNPADAVLTRHFELDDHKINDEKMDMDRIDAVATVGTTEIWEVTNSMGSPHNFHIHDVQFQILDIDGAAPPVELSGWKDTVYLSPERTYRLIMHFADYADADHPYMFHCHLLRHEDSGMMGQFLVLEPGQHLPDKWSTPDSDDDSKDSDHGMDMDMSH